jgi:hydroxymethylbilane synthase
MLLAYDMSPMSILKLGTRGSPLALAQTREVEAALQRASPLLAEPGAIETVIIRTTGDKIQNRALADEGGKALFVKEIEEALLDGRIDIGVHSAKDLPTLLPDGLAIGAVLKRADARDAFFARGDYTLETLPAGSVVGTASPRRQALVLSARPDLKVTLMRGNVDTRLKKLVAGEVDATLLAVAGLERLGEAHRIRVYLDPNTIVPAAGQGAIALEIRAGDESVAAIAGVNHRESFNILAAERAVVLALEGSCTSPIAAWGREQAGEFVIDALAARLDGAAIHRVRLTGALTDMLKVGQDAGRQLKDALPVGFFA